MKKILLILLALAVLVIPVTAHDGYENIGAVMSHFLNTYSESCLTLNDMPKTVQVRSMTFELVAKDKYMVRYVDTEHYYQFDIWTTDGKVRLINKEWTYGKIGINNTELNYYIDWHDEEFSEKQFAYYLLSDDARKRIRLSSLNAIYEVVRLKYWSNG